MEATLDHKSIPTIGVPIPLLIINSLAIELGIAIFWVIIAFDEILILFCGLLIFLLFLISKKWDDEIKFEKHLTPLVVISFLSQFLWYLLAEFTVIQEGMLLSMTAFIGGSILAYYDTFSAKKSITAKNGLDNLFFPIILLVIYIIIFHFGVLVIVFGLLNM